MKRIVDLQLNIDGLILNENETVDDFIKSIKANTSYHIVYEVLHEEVIK